MRCDRPLRVRSCVSLIPLSPLCTQALGSGRFSSPSSLFASDDVVDVSKLRPALDRALAANFPRTARFRPVLELTWTASCFFKIRTAILSDDWAAVKRLVAQAVKEMANSACPRAVVGE